MLVLVVFVWLAGWYGVDRVVYSIWCFYLLLCCKRGWGLLYVILCDL